jgi:hypothetical protein
MIFASSLSGGQVYGRAALLLVECSAVFSPHDAGPAAIVVCAIRSHLPGLERRRMTDSSNSRGNHNQQHRSTEMMTVSHYSRLFMSTAFSGLNKLQFRIFALGSKHGRTSAPAIASRSGFMCLLFPESRSQLQVNRSPGRH